MLELRHRAAPDAMTTHTPVPATARRWTFPNELWPDDWFDRLDPSDIFPSRVPVEVDLGCGEGAFLTGLAKAHPERGYLGIDRLLGRVRKCCRISGRNGLTNVRFLRLESLYAVEHLLPLGWADRIHMLFPDPWPKRRHWKRRLLRQTAFLRGVHGVLRTGGEFLFKTDHAGYLEDAREHRAWEGFFEEIAWDDNEVGEYPVTNFERHWLAEGRSIHRIRLRRLDAQMP